MILAAAKMTLKPGKISKATIKTLNKLKIIGLKGLLIWIEQIVHLSGRKIQ